MAPKGWTADTCRVNRERQRGMRYGKPAEMVWYVRGYRYLSGQHGHPLANKKGVVSEHRKVLYDAIGTGPHPCHWNDTTGCGRTALTWGGPAGIQADHLDDDKLNNTAKNLVASCVGCNSNRSRPNFRRLNVEKVREIRRLFAAGVHVAEIMRRINAGRGAVDAVLAGTTWRWVDADDSWSEVAQ